LVRKNRKQKKRIQLIGFISLTISNRSNLIYESQKPHLLRAANCFISVELSFELSAILLFTRRNTQQLKMEGNEVEPLMVPFLTRDTLDEAK
jgi:hypothetical protein